MPANPPPPCRPTAGGDGGDRFESDRGVSEVVSFILTFSMITIMIGILYTAGSVSLAELQTGNQMQNAEGVYIAMADSFGELQEGQAPKRAGAVDLDVGASIAVINESSVDVVVYNATGQAFSKSIVTRSIDYRLDERAITYETGAVFRSNKGNSAIVHEPSGIFCSPETDSAVVSVVTLEDPDGASVASGTATVTGLQRSSRLLFPDDRNTSAIGDVQNVTLDVASEHEAAWHRHLADVPGWEDPEDDGSYTCEDVDQVYVRHTVIEIRVNG